MNNNDEIIETGKEKARELSRKAENWIEPLARFGYATKGLVYFLIGVIAAYAAVQTGNTASGSRGVLETVVHQPFGQVLLAFIIIGLIGYSLWRFVQAIKDTENKGSDAKGIGIRLAYAVVGVAYASLAVFSVKLIIGSDDETTGASASQEWTATMLAQPFGQIIVGIIGLGFIAFALFQFYSAYTRRFREKFLTEEMNRKTEKVVNYLGRVGLSARGVVFSVIGIFLLRAAYLSNAGEVRGLGGALRALEQQAYGGWILGLTALGLMFYGVFMFAMAWYRRISA